MNDVGSIFVISCLYAHIKVTTASYLCHYIDIYIEHPYM